MVVQSTPYIIRHWIKRLSVVGASLFSFAPHQKFGKLQSWFPCMARRVLKNMLGCEYVAWQGSYSVKKYVGV